MPDITGMAWIAPSRHNAWAGGREDAFTPLQQATLDRMGAEVHRRRRAAGHPPERYVVRCPIEESRFGSVPRTVGILCPVLSWTRDRRRILVIAPDGSAAWVDFK